MINLNAYIELNPDYKKIDNEHYGFTWMSLKDNLNSHSYENEELIAEYLENNGEENLSILGFHYDVFTGEKIGHRHIKRDGIMSWNSAIPYYIRKYHLRLPVEAEEYILKQIRNSE